MVRKEDNISKTNARAIVVSSKVKASALNFMKRFGNRPYPQQFFSIGEDAYNWLRALKQA